MRYLLLLLALLAIGVSGAVYFVFFMPNVNTQTLVSINIPSGAAYRDVLNLLNENKVLKHPQTFEVVSNLKKYPSRVKPGHYVFTRKMNNRQIVNMLMAGLQQPVKLVVYNIRTKDEFASLVGRTLELDSAAVMQQLNSNKFAAKRNSDTAAILARFIVDNYELYWTTSIDRLFEKLDKAYNNFWNTERLAKAQALGLSPTEVVVLASVVEKEVMRDKELPTVAGVYLNRLKIGMPLQADPTLVFALRDFDARRVTSVHKDFDSPYNTYKYAGLPPGPICMPRKKSIDAVLNHEQHKYMYFCANPDLSGYSIFSETYQEQMRVAREYRQKLNAMNIR